MLLLAAKLNVRVLSCALALVAPQAYSFKAGKH